MLSSGDYRLPKRAGRSHIVSQPPTLSAELQVMRPVRPAQVLDERSPAVTCGGPVTDPNSIVINNEHNGQSSGTFTAIG